MSVASDEWNAPEVTGRYAPWEPLFVTGVLYINDMWESVQSVVYYVVSNGVYTYEVCVYTYRSMYVQYGNEMG